MLMEPPLFGMDDAYILCFMPPNHFDNWHWDVYYTFILCCKWPNHFLRKLYNHFYFTLFIYFCCYERVCPKESCELILDLALCLIGLSPLLSFQSSMRIFLLFSQDGLLTWYLQVCIWQYESATCTIIIYLQKPDSYLKRMNK